MSFFKRLQTRYVLHRYAIRHDIWQVVTEPLPVLQGLSAVEKAHLRELSTLFLRQKNIIGVEIEIAETIKVTIAAQACLPILQLGLGLLSGWSDIVVYPSAFYTQRDETDEYGIVHHRERLLSGEAWSRGPLVLSWGDIENDRLYGRRGHNVIIHEIAHKLDMLDGSSNGMPPLHYKMPIPEWTSTLSKAYDELHRILQHHQRSCINPYAASSPAEFFAVFSEYFFCAPDVLKIHFSDVYSQLSYYYRQDPFGRLKPSD
ncbi:MAG: M90 family metallopeptidase [Gammaproteobacteria bacterium]